MSQSHREAMSGSTTTLRLQNGHTFICKPLTEIDHCELEAWARRQYLENIRHAVAALPAADRDEYLRLALDEAQKVSIRYGIGQQWITDTVGGICRLAYQFVKAHCSLTEDQWAQEFLPEGVWSAENIDAFHAVMKYLTPEIPSAVKARVEQQLSPYADAQKKSPKENSTNGT